MNWLLVLLHIFLFIGCSSQFDLECSSGWQSLIGDCFYISTVEKTWKDAKTFCDAKGATLAQPFTVTQVQALADLLNEQHSFEHGPGNYSYWLGGGNEPTRNYRWISDIQVTAGWAEGEPNTNEPGSCVVIGYNTTSLGVWSCSEWATFICQRPGEPTTTNYTAAATTTTQDCGGEFSSSRGRIRHPLIGGNYTNNENCTWIIRAESPITIKFVFFDTEEIYDNLLIHHNDRIHSPLLGNFSGDYVPSPVKTIKNAAYLLFTSDSGTTRPGFELHWETSDPECGGEYNSSSGTIVHPLIGGHPFIGGLYTSNETCTWIIKAAFPIKIIFVKFDTEEKYDYLYVRDGERNESHVYGNFSGDIIPSPVQTNTNTVHLLFTSDSSTTRTGFKLHWERSDCFGEYNSSSGIIRHPLSGSNYTNHEKCIWIIRAESPIKMKFIFFDTEERYDYLYVRDGESIGSHVLGNFSGDSIPRPFQTTTNTAHLLFTSDSSSTRTGFELHWETSDCGGEFNSSSGTIRHPLSGSNYTNNEKCIWIIRAESPINIKFVFFDTEKRYDYLNVRDGESNRSHLLGIFSGDSIPRPLQTTTNTAHLLFSSDGSAARTGFELHWYTSECGGEYNSSMGIIRHPLKGDNYTNNENCTWIIRASSPIKIKFVIFDTEERYDKLYVRDGKDDGLSKKNAGWSTLLSNWEIIPDYDQMNRDGERNESHVYGIFSGDSVPRPVQTSKNTIHLLFTSDSSNTRTGFELHWEPSAVPADTLIPYKRIKSEHIQWKQGCFLGIRGDCNHFCLCGGDWSRSYTLYLARNQRLEEHFVYIQNSYPHNGTISACDLQYGSYKMNNGQKGVFYVYHDKSLTPYQQRFSLKSDGIDWQILVATSGKEDIGISTLKGTTTPRRFWDVNWLREEYLNDNKC